MALVSIIVPVYNVEKYLKRCVESLLSQTLKDIEIILVDDGSTDNCPALCDEFSKIDDRITVVHKHNGGLSSARNAGLKVAKGKYIGFIDSDDTANPTMFEDLVSTIQKEHVDFVMSDYIRIEKNDQHFLKTVNIAGGKYSKDDIKSIIFPNLIMGSNIDYGPLLSVWHCLYDSAFLKTHDIKFDEEVRWSEDNIFSSIVGYYAESFYYLKGKGLYNYFQNPGTITTTYRKGSWDVYCTMNKHLKEFFKDKTDYDFSNQLKLHLIYYACVSTRQTKILRYKERKQELIKILYTPELISSFKNINLNYLPLKLKLYLFLIKNKRVNLLNFIIKRK